MPQHKKISLRKIEDFLDYLEHANQHQLRDAGEDLFRLLSALDAFLVKHDRSDLARRLRAAFDKLEDGL